MKRYSQQDIATLLDKFMDGQTSLDEEKILADHFRSHDVPAEWEDYRAMFGYFDRGMEGELVPEQAPRVSLTKALGRQWWGIAAAAAIAVFIVGTVVLNRPSAPASPEIAEVPDTETQAKSASTEETQDLKTVPIGETQDLASLQNQSKPAVETRHLASQSTKRKPSRSASRLQTENAKLARENERLQRELADLKRRAFIIDLEANGYKTVLNEDGNIVLIDLEQEIENELNNQPTTNIPAI